MRNQEQVGSVKNWTNDSGSDVASGGVVVMGHIIGIAITAIAAGAVGAVDFTPGKVFNNIPKVSAAVFTAGEKLLWDASAGKFDDSAASGSTGDIMGAVVAWTAGANAETTCTVMLTPGNATKT